MRNVWLIARREYLQRVRTKAFLFSTLMMPLFMGAVIILPGWMATMKTGGPQKLAVVASSPELAERISRQLGGEQRPGDAAPAGRMAPEAPRAYEVSIFLDPTETRREKLLEEVRAKRLDGFLWLSEEAVEAGRVDYVARSTSDFVQRSQLERSVTQAVTRNRIAGRGGIPPSEVDALFAPVRLQVQDATATEASAARGPGAFIGAVIMMFVLYISVLIYGITVMRSVLEEKTSRVMEVLLSAVTAKELMAGKLLGVGSVGLTQLFIWLGAGALLSVPGLVASADLIRQANIGIGTVAYFVPFYIGGFLLYSAIYAALGAMVNSEEEAQSLQFFAMMPLILSTVFMWFVIRNPEAPLSVFLSLFPLTSPLLMYLRIGVQTPPAWQIALCFALLIAGIYAVIWACSRIYRVGILMYGKKPNLPELLRWIRYA
jgi:ABC-2 type transport system permease protein